MICGSWGHPVVLTQRFVDVRSSIDLLYSYMYIDIIYNKNKNLHVYIRIYEQHVYAYGPKTEVAKRFFFLVRRFLMLC